MEQREKEIESKLRFNVNLNLMIISFTILALFFSLNPSLLKQSLLISVQLTTSIPLLLSAAFASTKLRYILESKLWKKYAVYTFLIGYSFLINSIGIILSSSISLKISLIFFILNILISMTYSAFIVIEDKSKLTARIKKDLLFSLILFFGGILPSMHLQ